LYNNNSIQFIYYFRANLTATANYKVSTSKKNETTKHLQDNTKEGSLYNNNNIIIIIIIIQLLTAQQPKGQCQ
jgi:hypothetical protein